MKLIDKDALVAEMERLVNNQDSALDYEAALEDVRNFIDTLEVKEVQEEPVSIDFEQELYKAFGQVKDFTLGMRIAKWFYDMGKNSQEPVSEDFEKEMDNYIPTVFSKDMDSGEPRFTTWFRALRKTARHFANWQKNKMMEDAVDGIVAASAGALIATGFVKSEDVNVKFGDKIKIIVVKED